MKTTRRGPFGALFVLFVLFPLVHPIASGPGAQPAVPAGGVAGSGDAGAGPPDIVIINTDDQRFDSLAGCLAPGAFGRPAPLDGLPAGRRCPMPEMKRHLADVGVTFLESFVTTALCCPSRASTFTGRYAHVTGVLTNTKPHGGIGAFRHHDHSTVATWLDDAGYRTSLIGKYVNQYKCKTPPCAPPPGWDDWHAELTDGDGNYSNFQLNDDGLVSTYPGYHAPVLGQKAVHFIGSTPPSEPLFLYFAPFGPHPPAEPATRDQSAYDGMPDWRPPSWNTEPTNGPAWLATNPTPNFAARDAEHRNQIEVLLDIDRQIAAIVDALGPRISNTLIVFTSDNGISWGEHRYYDKKNCEYEECHRVPMVVRFDPLTGGAGRVDGTHLVQNIDLAATALDAAAASTGAATDGRSFLPLLTAAVPDDPDDWPTSVLGEDYGSLITCSGCVRPPTLTFARTFPQHSLGAWKYVELDTGERELYDQAADPYETANVASDPGAATTRDALDALLDRLTSTQPPAVSLAGGPPAATNQTSVSVSFSAAGASRFWCSLDGAPRTPCTSPFNAPGPLADGQHSLRVVAEGTDLGAGRQGTSAPAVRTWTVDTRPPGTVIDAGPAEGETTSTSATFEFSSNESGATFDCSLDGRAPAGCTSPRTYTGLGGGPHRFEVAATDRAGNRDGTPAIRTWSVRVEQPDIVAPSVAWLEPDPDRLLRVTSLTLKWTGSDPAPSSGPPTYTVEERAGLTGAWSPIATRTATRLDRTALAAGTTTCWRITARDPAGNQSSTAERCVAVPRDERNLTRSAPFLDVDDPGAFQGTLTVLTGAGGRVGATVTGRKVGLLFQRGPTYGRARVLLDGVVVKTVDLYRSTVSQRWFGWNAVFPGVETHAVRVAWTGTRSAAATGTAIPVDGLAVIGHPAGPASSPQQR